MILYQIELKVSGVNADAATFRVWLDSPSDSFDSESEVSLVRVDGTWKGAFIVPKRQRTGFYYRVGLVATPGSWWSLVIRDSATGVETVRDGDQVSEPKTWSLGSWGLGARDVRPTQPVAARRSGARARKAGLSLAPR
jgi:hypothetical protein